MLESEDIKRIKDMLMDEILPIGSIIAFPSGNIPKGFMVCDGRCLMRSDYPKLYAVIGDCYGGEQDTFCLPDLRGKFIRGIDTTGIYDPEKNRAVGSYQEDAIQGHTHELRQEDDKTGAAGAHYHLFYANYWDCPHTYSTTQYTHENKDFDGSYVTKTSEEPAHQHTLPRISLGEVQSTNYGRVSVDIETRPKNVALNFCIKVK